jgi:uroporphyrin-III C-methyltransferase
MGKVYLVGAGPGAPDLLTLRAARLLEQADIVFHDALVHADVLAIASRARLVSVGKRCSRISTDQRFINRVLCEAAARYRTVVRLKGGDPMLFGRAQEEIEALQAAKIDFEVVPGVTAALSASAELGISLTRRGVSRSVVLVTPRIGADEADSAWARAAAAADTAVLYMGAGQAVHLVEALHAAGLPLSHPATIVERASLPGQRVLHGTLATLARRAQQAGEGPTLVILGAVLRAAAADDDEAPLALRAIAGLR